MTQIEPTDDEVAAALAAVQSYLQAETTQQQLPSHAPRSTWRDAALLAVQQIGPARLPAPTWGNIERLRKMGSR